jgi:transposase
MLQAIWAGVDIGKEHHHAVVIDADGNRLLSQRVLNGEAELLQLIDQVEGLAGKVVWAVDIVNGGAALLLALLVSRGLEVLYISSTMVSRAAGGYRGDGKTDARDAAIIADQARMRRGLTPLRVDDELVVELQLLVARRRDLVADRVRTINRLREQLLGIFPALERCLDMTRKGPLSLLTKYQRPAKIREAGAEQIRAWLLSQKARRTAALADRVVQAAQAQQISLPGERLAAHLVAELARTVLQLTSQIEETDQMIDERFHQHALAEILLSMPGIGSQLGAEFIAATGGDMTAFTSADHLAGYAGVAPVPRDSGRISGNLHRPRRYNRLLNHVFYVSAMISIRCNADSRRFYDRKRTEGKSHSQAVLALARRRVNVIWALTRDQRIYHPIPPAQHAA